MIEHFFGDTLASALPHHSRPGSCLHWGCPDAPKPIHYSALAVGRKEYGYGLSRNANSFPKAKQNGKGSKSLMRWGRDEQNVALSTLEMEQWEETSECKDTPRFRPLRAFVHSVFTSYTLAKNAVCSCSKSHFFCIAFGASALVYLSWIQETFANINPSWVCPPETWARSCESFSDVALLGCSDPSQALHHLPYHRPASQPRPAPSPASFLTAAVLKAFAAPNTARCVPGSSPLLHQLLGILFYKTRALLSHLPFIFSLRIALNAPCKNATSLNSYIYPVFCLFMLYICSIFPLIFVGITLWNVSAKMGRVFIFSPPCIFTK